jgi:hypothetical protein
MDYPAIFREGAVSEAVTRWALHLLQDIAAGDSDIRAVCHPLGFLCFPIERQGDCGACVHLWSPRLALSPPTTSVIHAHSWDLISLVLAGELRNDLVTVRDGMATHRVYEVHSGGDVDEIRATSRLVGCRTERSELNRAGDTYRVGVGQFHATVATEATTVALGRGRTGAIDLSLGAVHGRTHRVQRRHCDRSETARLARMVTRQLSSAREA